MPPNRAGAMGLPELTRRPPGEATPEWNLENGDMLSGSGGKPGEGQV